MRMIDGDALLRDMETMWDWHTVNGIQTDTALRQVMTDIRNAPTVGGWISVQDRLPDYQTPVLIYVPAYIDELQEEWASYVGMAYYTYSVGGGFWCGTDGNQYGAIGRVAVPTHWMPLPEPPGE